jgi:Fatty acid hydroxylase
MTIASEFLRIGGTAALTHYLVSFCQTVFHQRLGHRRLGGKLFRNHVRWHHGYYAGDHMVSEKYLTEHGNNTPFFLIPIAGVAAAAWSFLPMDLFVTHVATLALSFYVHVYLDAQYHVTGCWLGRFRWFRRKQQLHFVHHQHANANFAVIDFFWDRLLGTFRTVDGEDDPQAAVALRPSTIR